MLFWNSLAFFMGQQMLAIWSLVPLPFVNPACTSESSQFTYCLSLPWRILSITLLACEMSAVVWQLDHSLALPFFGIGMNFPDGSVGKESTCNAGDTGDMGLIPGLGRSPGGWHGNSLQYPCLENPMNRGAWGVQSTGLQRIRHNLATDRLSFTYIYYFSHNSF